jgi:hypothetical protein
MMINVTYYIIPDKPSRGEIVTFRCCNIMLVAGVLFTELLGVINGVMGGPGSTFGFAIVAAPKARVWLLSRRRFGASLIFGCV